MVERSRDGLPEHRRGGVESREGGVNDAVVASKRIRQRTARALKGSRKAEAVIANSDLSKVLFADYGHVIFDLRAQNALLKYLFARRSGDDASPEITMEEFTSYVNLFIHDGFLNRDALYADLMKANGIGPECANNICDFLGRWHKPGYMAISGIDSQSSSS